MDANVSKARGKLRAVEQEILRDALRDPPRTTTAVAEGRSRKRKTHIDPYQIPPEIIPVGWVYQWCRQSVFNEPDLANMTHMRENGWTPVPCERHEGMYMAPGHRGDIVRGGLILMERPKELSDEARAEEEMLARQQVEAQKQQLGLSMPDGFASQRANLRTSYERGPAQARHTVAVD